MESKVNELKALQILYKALLIGQLLFGMIAFFLVSRGLFDPSFRSITYILLTVIAVSSIVIIVGSYFMFRKRLEKVKQLTDLSEKLQDYRAACIAKWALFEFPCLLSIIFYFMTGQAAFLLLGVLLMLNFISNYPSKDKVLQELELSSQEEALFE